MKNACQQTDFPTRIKNLKTGVTHFSGSYGKDRFTRAGVTVCGVRYYSTITYPFWDVADNNEEVTCKNCLNVLSKFDLADEEDTKLFVIKTKDNVYIKRRSLKFITTDDVTSHISKAKIFRTKEKAVDVVKDVIYKKYIRDSNYVIIKTEELKYSEWINLPSKERMYWIRTAEYVIKDGFKVVEVKIIEKRSNR